MPRGGRRAGAGRPKGAKNKLTVLREVAGEYGTTPLDYLLAVMADDSLPTEVRMFAAKAALPYCTPRLAAVRVDTGAGVKSHAEWVRELAAMDGLALASEEEGS